MNKKTYLMLALASIFTLFSCNKLDKFSDANTITSFKVDHHYPEQIIIENARLDADTIFIPIVYGRYEFPMHFGAHIETADDAHKIVGLDFSKELTFETIDSEISFFVVAQSGATREYFIRPLEIPLDENNLIFKNVSFNNITPQETILSHSLHASSIGDTMYIQGIELTYPITLSPNFNISATSKFGSVTSSDHEQDPLIFVNGETPLTFNDSQSSHTLEVIAQSGLKKEWVISFKSSSLIDATHPKAQSVTIDARKSSALVSDGNLQIMEMMVDQEHSLITIELANQSPESAPTASRASRVAKAAPISSPISINMNLYANEWIHMIDMQRDSTLVFNSYQDTVSFFLLNPFDNVARQWKICAKEQKSETATVLSFQCDYDITTFKINIWDKNPIPSIVMDPDKKVLIYPQSKEILLIYNSYNEDSRVFTTQKRWSIALHNISLTLSPDATCEIPTIKWEATKANQAGDLIGEARTLDVVSEDGKVVKWSIRLHKSDVAISSDCDLLGFNIKKVIPAYTQFEEEPISIDLTNNVIMIKMKNDDTSYPMQIFPQYQLSPYASVISQSNASRPLIFQNQESTQEITVQAQDGSSTKTFTVKLISSEKTDGADISQIDLGALSPSDFKVSGELTYDVEHGTITIPIVSNDANFPLNIAYTNIVISESASMSTPTRGTFIFNKSTDLVPVVVNAQNGKPKIWNIKLEYRPQLRNKTIDLWSGNDPQPANYWATANNSFSTGTVPESLAIDEPSDLVAVLTTKSILGKMAAGTLFNGRFDKANITAGLNDPVSLTFFGVPFAPTAKIKGVMVDLCYHPATADQDWASATIQLIYWDGQKPYVFHGDRPGASPTSPSGGAHPDNTAVIAGEGSMKFSTGSNITSFDHPAMVLTDNEWTKDIFIPVNGDVKFTHLNVVFSSSAYGDYLQGLVNSVLKVNNVRIIYE